MNKNNQKPRQPSSSPPASQPTPPGTPERGRSRSRQRRPRTPEDLMRRGYHSFDCHSHPFYVEKRWRLVRELGQGAYGLVVSAQDEITGECVAIKMVTRIFDKPQLAKRALREITLLRHFNNHENITGLIDMDFVHPEFNEIYLYMEPMEADLYQIIRSQQILTNAHVQYFLYQILRGVKFIHSAGVVHRDLKPGNLLVNADCELKICDFGLARGYDSRPDENGTQMTEYVATRWYRAPEIMLSFRGYNSAIDIWSIGCILGELLGGKPMFKGKDYVDQLNCILNILGTPDPKTIQRIGSEKAQVYVRNLPFKRPVSYHKLFPTAEKDALDLISKLLAFDPVNRPTVREALAHPYLASYHEVGDEPSCPKLFDKWRDIEEITTMEGFKEAITREIEEFREEVRSVEKLDEVERLEEVARQAVLLQIQQHEQQQRAAMMASGGGEEAVPSSGEPDPLHAATTQPDISTTKSSTVGPDTTSGLSSASATAVVPFPSSEAPDEDEVGPMPIKGSRFTPSGLSRTVSDLAPRRRVRSSDPFATYVRRTSLLSSQAPTAQPTIFHSSFFEPPVQMPTPVSGTAVTATGTTATATAAGTATAVLGTAAAPTVGAFTAEPSEETFIVPTRSRMNSSGDSGGAVGPLLRQLSTVSISDTVPIAEAAKAVGGGEGAMTMADAPPSSFPTEFRGDRDD